MLPEEISVPLEDTSILVNYGYLTTRTMNRTYGHIIKLLLTMHVKHVTELVFILFGGFMDD